LFKLTDMKRLYFRAV